LSFYFVVFAGEENTLDGGVASEEVGAQSYGMDGSKKNVSCWQTVRLSLILCPLWFLMNFTFNMGFSTFIFEIQFPKNP